jgi:hypothetical protein
MAVEQDLSVRALEKLAKASKAPRQRTDRYERRDSFYDEAERILTEQLGRKVKVIAKGDNGTVQLEFYGKDDLAALADRLVPQE